MKNLANNNGEFYIEFTAGCLERVATNAYISFNGQTVPKFNFSKSTLHITLEFSGNSKIAVSLQWGVRLLFERFWGGRVKFSYTPPPPTLPHTHTIGRNKRSVPMAGSYDTRCIPA